MKDDEPSYTSFIVARAILSLGGDAYGRQFLPSGCLEAQILLLKCCGLPFGRFPWLICNPIAAKIARWLPFLFTGVRDILPGVGFRKIWIEHQTRQALKLNGASQVLVVAAGYDTLAYRLAPEFEHVSFVEVDHPATGKVKQAGLLKMNCPSNLHLVQADLTKQKLSHVLQNRIFFDPTKSTVIIMEGLTMYLTGEIIKETFGELARSVGPGSLSLIDFLSWNDAKQTFEFGPSTGLALLKMKRLGEPMLWGMHPSKIADFFMGTRWRVCTPVESKGFENVVGLSLKDDK